MFVVFAVVVLFVCLFVCLFGGVVDSRSFELLYTMQSQNTFLVFVIQTNKLLMSDVL